MLKSLTIFMLFVAIFLNGCQGMALVHSKPRFENQQHQQEQQQQDFQNAFVKALKSAMLGIFQKKMNEPVEEPKLCIDVYGFNDCSVASAVRGRRYFMMMH
jgi:PBP1b-binding outer membrane lipoprotein LpoB